MAGEITGYPDCEPCEAYFRHRNVGVLVRGVLETSRAQGVSTSSVTQRFIDGLHERHLAGKSIEVDTTSHLDLEPPTVRPYVIPGLAS